jgi:hypothetical protein
MEFIGHGKRRSKSAFLHQADTLPMRPVQVPAVDYSEGMNGKYKTT